MYASHSGRQLNVASVFPNLKEIATVLLFQSETNNYLFNTGYGNRNMFLLCAVSLDSLYMPLLSVAMEIYKPGEELMVQLKGYFTDLH